MESGTKYDFKRQASLFLEKTFSTFVQSFITFWLLADTLDASTAQAAALAAIAAAGTAALAALPIVPDGLPFATDLLFRSIRTFVVAAGTLFFAGNNGQFELSISAAQAAAVAAAPVVLTLLKGAFARKFGEPESAALLSAKTDPSHFALAA